MRFSPKQMQVLRLFAKGGFRRINLLWGSVRSGKTFVSLAVWGMWVGSSPKDRSYLMAGKTLTTLERNVLRPLSEMYGSAFSYSLSKKQGTLFGRTVYLEGASNAASESKLRGMTLGGAYCDELSLFDEGFFTMLLSRLSLRGAKLFATTNPDAPSHWLKKDFLDNPDVDMLSIEFGQEDNCFLPEEYRAALRTEFCGVMYDRFIRGQWAAAEGRVYEDFSPKNVLTRDALAERLRASPLILTTIGVDYGGNGSASAFVHAGFDEGFGNVYILSEFYDKRNRSAECLIASFADFTSREKQRFPQLRAAYCDSAEQLLVKSFRACAGIEVRNALKRPINTRINMVNRLIATGRFFVSEECVHVIDALESALWDEKEIHRDARLDNGTTNIDSLDAMEYAIERFESELFRTR